MPPAARVQEHRQARAAVRGRQCGSRRGGAVAGGMWWGKEGARQGRPNTQ